MTKGMQLGVSSHLFIFGHLPIFHFAALETLPVTQVEINLIAIDMRTIFGTREPFSSTATPETWVVYLISSSLDYFMTLQLHSLTLG